MIEMEAILIRIIAELTNIALELSTALERIRHGKSNISLKCLRYRELLSTFR